MSIIAGKLYKNICFGGGGGRRLMGRFVFVVVTELDGWYLRAVGTVGCCDRWEDNSREMGSFACTYVQI